jgi:hypothetical protein
MLDAYARLAAVELPGTMRRKGENPRIKFMLLNNDPSRAGGSVDEALGVCLGRV